MAMSTFDSFQVANQGIPTLSCENCRQRKIRCDKLSPCTNCQKFGVTCESVRRKRLPRGRHTRKAVRTQDLMDKVDRLEALVNVALAESSDEAKKGGDGASHKQIEPDLNSARLDVIDSSQKEHASEPPPGLDNNKCESRSMTSHYWTRMLKEIRESQIIADEDTEDDDDDPNEDLGSTSSALGRGQNQSLFTGLSLGRLGPAPLYSLWMRPSPAITAALCDIYLDQVDRIFKILHRPSVKQHLIHGKPHSPSGISREADNALDAAIFYAAVASMTDRQCYGLFQCGQSDSLPEFQSACERALERADLMRTSDITVLQAFVLYLIATRAHDKSRAVWTLLATAVRIAQALNLHIDSLHRKESLFDQQMRKRLWLTICFLDLQTCFDPDSQPLIPLEKTQMKLPLNVNDSDIDESSTALNLTERDVVTDMTFALITYNLQGLGRRLYYTAPEDSSTRKEIIGAFQNNVSSITRHCNPDDSDYSWFVHHASRALSASSELHMFRRPDSSHHDPNQLLELVSKVLENTPRMQNDKRGEGFRWYITPQWPPIVLAIRECYASTDVALVKRVWPLVEFAFENYRTTHTDANDRARISMLSKLLEKSRTRVNAFIQQDSVDNATSIDCGVQSIDQMDTSFVIGWDDLLNDLSYGEFPGSDLVDWTNQDNFFG